MAQDTPPARFGQPTKTSRPGGMHVALEVISKRGEHVFGLKHRKSKDVYFPKETLLFGEDFDSAVRRILHEHMSCTVEDFYLTTVKNRIDKDAHWELRLVAICEVDQPKAEKGYSLEQFTESTMPSGLVGWTHARLLDALER